VSHRRAGVLTAAVLAALLPVTGASAASALDPAWTAVLEVPLPSAAIGAELRDVTVLSPTEVWVVGAWRDRTSHPLAARWDGTSWRSVKIQDTTPTAARISLNAVDAVATGDVWAVGTALSTTGTTPVATTLVMHQTGTSWSVVPSPSPQAADSASVLNDVDLLSAAEGWAVGSTTTGAKAAQPLIQRWQLGQWVAVAAPALNASGAELTSVNVRSTTDAWAAGSQRLTDGSTAALLPHWTASAGRWRSRPSAPPATTRHWPASRR
jgi:hypothetical protein